MSPSKKTKGILAIIAGILLVVIGSALTGCTTETVIREVPVTAEPAIDTTPDTLSPSTLEEVFWITIVDQIGYKYERYLVIDTAKAVCTALDDGMTFTDVLLAAIGTSTDPEFAGDVGTIIGAGVPAFCPHWNDEMQAFAAQNGA